MSTVRNVPRLLLTYVDFHIGASQRNEYTLTRIKPPHQKFLEPNPDNSIQVVASQPQWTPQPSSANSSAHHTPTAQC